MSDAPADRPRILLVEDIVLLLLDLEQTLLDLGYVVVGMAASLDDGVALARTLDIDAAVLDVDIGGREVQPVAQVLAERGIPFVLATARSTRDLPAPLRGRPRHGKPYRAGELDEVLKEVLGARDGREHAGADSRGVGRAA